MITLVLGGASSGKSALAERLAAGTPPVSFLATGNATDEEMAARIAAHRARRPPEWTTVEAEAAQVVGEVRRAVGTLLLDSLTTWVAAAPGFEVDAGGLCRALQERAGDSVVVSDEVGLGVHPSSEPGRRFREALGRLNQAVAAVADAALLVVAGRVLTLEAHA